MLKVGDRVRLNPDEFPKGSHWGNFAKKKKIGKIVENTDDLSGSYKIEYKKENGDISYWYSPGGHLIKVNNLKSESEMV